MQALPSPEKADLAEKETPTKKLEFAASNQGALFGPGGYLATTPSKSSKLGALFDPQSPSFIGIASAGGHAPPVRERIGFWEKELGGADSEKGVGPAGGQPGARLAPISFYSVSQAADGGEDVPEAEDAEKEEKEEGAAPDEAHGEEAQDEEVPDAAHETPADSAAPDAPAQGWEEWSWDTEAAAKVIEHHHIHEHLHAWDHGGGGDAIWSEPAVPDMGPWLPAVHDAGYSADWSEPTYLIAHSCTL